MIFGVGSFIAALAQTQGFETFYINTVLGSEGAVVITDRFQEEHTQILNKDPNKSVLVASQQERKFYPGISDAYRIIRVLSTYNDVVACSPIVEGRALLRSGFSNEAVSLQGIDLDLHLRTTDFAKQVSKGSIEDFRNAVPILRQSLEKAGRDPANFPISKRIFMAVDNKPERAKAELLKWYTDVYHNPAGTETSGLHGTPAQVRERLHEIIGMGATHLLLNPISRHEEQLDALAEITGMT